MLGREKAEFLATLVKKARPALVVECGTAIGYSGLFLLQAICGIDKGRLITIEMEADRSYEAQVHFGRAGFNQLVDSWVGDGRGTAYHS